MILYIPCCEYSCMMGLYSTLCVCKNRAGWCWRPTSRVARQQRRRKEGENIFATSDKEKATYNKDVLMSKNSCGEKDANKYQCAVRWSQRELWIIFKDCRCSSKIWWSKGADLASAYDCGTIQTITFFYLSLTMMSVCTTGKVLILVHLRKKSTTWSIF